MTGSLLCRIAQVCLRVRDLGRSVAFYRDLFSLTPGPGSAPGGPPRQRMATVGVAKEGFGILLTRAIAKDEFVLPEQIAFEVATPQDVIVLYQRAKELGVSATEPRVCGGQWKSLIFDPDGHRIEIQAGCAVEDWEYRGEASPGVVSNDVDAGPS